MMLTRHYLVAFIFGRGASAFTSIGDVTAQNPMRAIPKRSITTNYMAGIDEQMIMPMLSRRSALSSFLAVAAAGTVGMAIPTGDAHAAEGSRTIGQISGSGLVFKDTLVVESFDDPKVRGVTLYVSNFERPLTGEPSICFGCIVFRYQSLIVAKL
jgi:hypothetical protein